MTTADDQNLIATAAHDARHGLEQLDLAGAAGDPEETRRRLVLAAQQLRQASEKVCAALFGDTDRETARYLLVRSVEALPRAPDGSLQLAAA